MGRKAHLTLHFSARSRTPDSLGLPPSIGGLTPVRLAGHKNFFEISFEADG